MVSQTGSGEEELDGKDWAQGQMFGAHAGKRRECKMGKFEGCGRMVEV